MQTEGELVLENAPKFPIVPELLVAYSQFCRNSSRVVSGDFNTGCCDYKDQCDDHTSAIVKQSDDHDIMSDACENVEEVYDCIDDYDYIHQYDIVC